MSHQPVRVRYRATLQQVYPPGPNAELLEAQDIGLDEFEVIVVDDESSDTAQMSRLPSRGE